MRLNVGHTEMLDEHFYEDISNSLRTGTLKSIQIHYGLWEEFLFSTYIIEFLNCTEHDEMNIVLSRGENTFSE